MKAADASSIVHARISPCFRSRLKRVRYAVSYRGLRPSRRITSPHPQTSLYSLTFEVRSIGCYPEDLKHSKRCVVHRSRSRISVFAHV